MLDLAFDVHQGFRASTVQPQSATHSRVGWGGVPEGHTICGDSAGLPELGRAVPQWIGLTDHYDIRWQIGYDRRAYRRDRPALLICRGKAARARRAASWMVSLARLMASVRRTACSRVTSHCLSSITSRTPGSVLAA